MRTLRLVNQLWFIVPVTHGKFARLPNYYIEAIDHKFPWFINYGLINHSGCW